MDSDASEILRAILKSLQAQVAYSKKMRGWIYGSPPLSFLAQTETQMMP